MTNLALCEAIFPNDYNSTLSGATCHLRPNLNQLWIVPSTQSSINVFTSVLTLLPSTYIFSPNISDTASYSFQSQNYSTFINLASAQIVPKVIIAGPPVIGLCADLVLHAKQSTLVGYTTPDYIWSAVGINIVNMTIDRDTLTIPRSELTAGIKTFTLSITKSPNIPQTASHIVTVKDNKVFPLIDLHSNCPQKWPKSQNLEIYIEVSIDFENSCVDDTNVTYTISATQQQDSNDAITLFQNTNQNSIFILGNSLTVGSTYTFTATVDLYNGGTSASVSDSCEIEIINSDLLPTIKGGNRVVTLNLGDIVTLDSTPTIDPDQPTSDSHLQYTWSCTVPYGSTTTGANCNFMSSLDTSNVVLFFNSDNLVAGATYKFIVVISDTSTGRSATASSTIITLASNPFSKTFSQIYIYPDFQYPANVERLVIHGPESNVDDTFTYSWQAFQFEFEQIFTYNDMTTLFNNSNDILSDLDILSKDGASSFNMILEQQALTAGKWYIFTLTAESDSNKGFAWFQLFVPYAPIVKSFSMSPTGGTSITSLFSMSLQVTGVETSLQYHNIVYSWYYASTLNPIHVGFKPTLSNVVLLDGTVTILACAQIANSSQSCYSHILVVAELTSTDPCNSRTDWNTLYPISNYLIPNLFHVMSAHFEKLNSVTNAVCYVTLYESLKTQVNQYILGKSITYTNTTQLSNITELSCNNVATIGYVILSMFELVQIYSCNITELSGLLSELNQILANRLVICSDACSMKSIKLTVENIVDKSIALAETKYQTLDTDTNDEIVNAQYCDLILHSQALFSTYLQLFDSIMQLNEVRHVLTTTTTTTTNNYLEIINSWFSVSDDATIASSLFDNSNYNFNVSVSSFNFLQTAGMIRLQFEIQNSFIFSQCKYIQDTSTITDNTNIITPLTDLALNVTTSQTNYTKVSYNNLGTQSMSVRFSISDAVAENNGITDINDYFCVWFDNTIQQWINDGHCTTNFANYPNLLICTCDQICTVSIGKYPEPVPQYYQQLEIWIAVGGFGMMTVLYFSTIIASICAKKTFGMFINRRRLIMPSFLVVHVTVYMLVQMVSVAYFDFKFFLSQDSNSSLLLRRTKYTKLGFGNHYYGQLIDLCLTFQLLSIVVKSWLDVYMLTRKKSRSATKAVLIIANSVLHGVIALTVISIEILSQNNSSQVSRIEQFIAVFMRAAALILGLFSPFIFSFFRMRTQKIHHFVDDLILRWEEEGGAAHRPSPDYMISECVIVRMKLLSYFVCIWFFLHVSSIFIIVQYLEYWLQFEIYLIIALQFTDICCIYVLIHLYRPTFGYLGLTSSKPSKRMQLSKVLRKQREKEQQKLASSVATNDGNVPENNVNDSNIDLLTTMSNTNMQESKSLATVASLLSTGSGAEMSGVTTEVTESKANDQNSNQTKTIDKFKGVFKRTNIKRISAKKSWTQTIDGVMLKPQNIPIDDHTMDVSDASLSSIPSHTRSAKFRKVQKLMTATNKAANKNKISKGSQFGFNSGTNTGFQSIVPNGNANGNTWKFDDSTTSSSSSSSFGNTQNATKNLSTRKRGSIVAFAMANQTSANTNTNTNTNINTNEMPQHRRNSMTAFAAMARKISTVQGNLNDSESDSIDSSSGKDTDTDTNKRRRGSMVIPKLNMADIVTERKKEFTFSPKKQAKSKRQLQSTAIDFVAKLQANSSLAPKKESRQEDSESSASTEMIKHIANILRSPDNLGQGANDKINFQQRSDRDDDSSLKIISSGVPSGMSSDVGKQKSKLNTVRNVMQAMKMRQTNVPFDTRNF